MTRKPSAWLLLATLALGVLLGIAIGRGGLTVLAQGDPVQVEAAAPTADSPPKLDSEEDVFGELGRQYDRFRQINRTYELVAKAVSPSVVHIVAKKPGRVVEGRRSHIEETGSGVIVRPSPGGDFFVLTNHHVVDGAKSGEIDVTLFDGRVIHPDRLWVDSQADVAVLKIGKRKNLRAARLGDSDKEAVGDWVLALGSPFGWTHSVTQGIISARGRHVKELQDDFGVNNQDFLQTDAAINPGNSGGPLVNMKGEVIGINNSIASNGGGSEGVGFSIPINLAKWIMVQLIESGRVSRGAMGVNLGDLRYDQAVALGLDRPVGAKVLKIRDGSPASQAGLQQGDVVLRFNGVEVGNLNHLINMVSMAPIGRPAGVSVWREGKELQTRVTVGDRDLLMANEPTRDPPTVNGDAERLLLRRPSRPDTNTPAEAAPKMPDLGLELITLDAKLNRALGLPEAVRGVAVAKIEAKSPWAQYVQKLDVINTIGGLPVKTAEDVAKALTKRTDRSPLELGLQRLVNGSMQRRTVKVP